MTGTANRVNITEYLRIDLETERWECRVCDCDLAERPRELQARPAGLRPRPARDPPAAPRPKSYEFTYAPDPTWCRILEYYCPGCGTHDRDRVPAARPSADARHRARHRRAEAQWKDRKRRRGAGQGS